MKALVKAALIAVFMVMITSGCQTSSHKASRDLAMVERTMTVTAYCPCKKCCSWKRNWFGRAVYASGPNKGDKKKVGQTASGAMAKRGTIAADASLPFGTPIYVPGYGEGVVQDRGGAINGDHIDVYFKKHKEALKWGRQKVTVQMWLPPQHTLVARR